MVERRSYVLCATPRTGSTLLCSLLSSTGVLGRPESYFREPGEVAWAKRFGLPTEGSHVRDYRAFVQAALTAGTTSNGVFGVRIMWGSLERVMVGLEQASGESDLLSLERVVGPLAFVHLRRADVVAQAVSWCRAEQTGAWARGDVITREPREDVEQMKMLAETIDEHNAAWRGWFDAQGVERCAPPGEGEPDDHPLTISPERGHPQHRHTHGKNGEHRYPAPPRPLQLSARSARRSPRG